MLFHIVKENSRNPLQVNDKSRVTARRPEPACWKRKTKKPVLGLCVGRVLYPTNSCRPSLMEQLLITEGHCTYK